MIDIGCRLGSKSNGRRPSKRRRGHTEKKMEAEIGVMQLQADEIKDGSQPPEARREARKDSPLQPSEGAQPCPHLDFGLLASRTVRQHTSVVLSHQVCGNLLQ